MDPRRKLKNKEAAEVLGVSPKTLPKWRCNKTYDIPYYKVGGKIYYYLDDLLAWLESRKVTA